mmetsp:Transcript_30106/g.80571  ORF Transcript_30106/g.80571 Transcript_30106/m.80571 type:complete len:240 (+) Transcript_30106:271-990(+)
MPISGMLVVSRERAPSVVEGRPSSLRLSARVGCRTAGSRSPGVGGGDSERSSSSSRLGPAPSEPEGATLAAKLSRLSSTLLACRLDPSAGAAHNVSTAARAMPATSSLILPASSHTSMFFNCCLQCAFVSQCGVTNASSPPSSHARRICACFSSSHGMARSAGAYDACRPEPTPIISSRWSSRVWCDSWSVVVSHISRQNILPVLDLRLQPVGEELGLCVRVGFEPGLLYLSRVRRKVV